MAADGVNDRRTMTGFAKHDTMITDRNLRDVWTVSLEPYPGAHFATFPTALVRPCIRAGCPPDGVVLDIFAGTGTVGLVAQQESRRAVLIDLNPDYLRQCLIRNTQVPLGL
jgi:DNA modification methylase